MPAIDAGRIVFGCGSFGGLGSSPGLIGAGDSREAALALLDQVRALGIRRFDTASTYGGGESERALGAWLHAQGRAYRGEIEIASKVGNPHGCPPGERPLSAAQVALHLDESLRRLGIEQIDLYYMHVPDRSTPIAETLEAFDLARRAGKIAAYGLSNVSLDQFRAAQAATPEGLRLRAVQNAFNLLKPGDRNDLIPACAAAGVAYIAYSPLAGGVLTGKYATADRAGGARAALVADDLTPENLAEVEALRARSVAAEIPMPELALRFVLDTPGVEAALIAPRRNAQFEAYGLTLD
jgi:aryl-alcohol dehydrogenase-like predicted oxidoreductase